MLIDNPKVEAHIRELMALTGEDEETVVLWQWPRCWNAFERNRCEWASCREDGQRVMREYRQAVFRGAGFVVNSR
jgi:hypothetical protein